MYFVSLSSAKDVWSDIAVSTLRELRMEKEETELLLRLGLMVILVIVMAWLRT